MRVGNILLVAALYVAAIGLVLVILDNKILMGTAFILIGVEVWYVVMFPPHRGEVRRVEAGGAV